MDWFERLTGFREGSYAKSQSRFELAGDRLISRPNGRSFGVGTLELVSLGELRSRAGDEVKANRRLRFGNVVGDVRELHCAPEYAGALFQVASQFNLLEMVGPSVSPENGVTRYEHDLTQGPACAMAAAGGLIFRNYFVPVEGGVGQTRERQLDGLAYLAAALAGAAGRPVHELLQMQNGYVFCSEDGLETIDQILHGSVEGELDDLRSRLRVGLHTDVEVTEEEARSGQLVSQIYCSALPVTYNSGTSDKWRRFASVVLEAAYEATLLAAALNARRGASGVVLLTRLGGGAFGNEDDWIDGAIHRALALCSGHDIDVRLVSFRTPPSSMIELERSLATRDAN